MASNYTSNYGLCQWAASDKVLRTEFNADNAKIDAAIKTVDTRVTSLSGSKASQSALDSLSQTVAGHTAALAKKGNCVLYTTSYTGNGTYGPDNARTLTFSGKPYLVVVSGRGGVMVMVQGTDSTMSIFGTCYDNRLTWSGNSVSWYHNGTALADGMMNRSGATYQVLALLKAG